MLFALLVTAAAWIVIGIVTVVVVLLTPVEIPSGIVQGWGSDPIDYAPERVGRFMAFGGVILAVACGVGAFALLRRRHGVEDQPNGLLERLRSAHRR
jgi:hypothetical protein